MRLGRSSFHSLLLISPKGCFLPTSKSVFKKHTQKPLERLFLWRITIFLQSTNRPFEFIFVAVIMTKFQPLWDSLTFNPRICVTFVVQEQFICFHFVPCIPFFLPHSILFRFTVNCILLGETNLNGIHTYVVWLFKTNKLKLNTNGNNMMHSNDSTAKLI